MSLATSECVSFLRSIRSIHNEWLRETETLLLEMEERLFDLSPTEVTRRDEAKAELELRLAQAKQKRHELVAREYSALTEAMHRVHQGAGQAQGPAGALVGLDGDDEVDDEADDRTAGHEEERRALDCEFRLLRKVRRHIISQIEARAAEPASEAREASLNTLDRDLNIVQKELKVVRARRQALGMTLGDYSIGPAAGEETDGLERLLKKVMEGVSPVKRRHDDEQRIESVTPIRPMAGQENPSSSQKAPTAIAASPTTRVAMPLRPRK
jgi:hypothetical protein